jgi:iron complex transport system substrate-binding protein
MRIASLLPSATEILFAIGAGDEVVGVTHECDHPDRVASLPRLTSSAIDHDGRTCAEIDRHIKGAVHSGSSIYRLDEPLLKELRPDLVVTQELCAVCAVAYDQVEAAVCRLTGDIDVLSLEPSSLEEVCASLVAVGRATGHLREAEVAATALRRRIDAVARLDPLPAPPRVVCVEWTEPLMVGGHWVPEMVRVAGGIDPLGPEGSPSVYVEWERILEADPEVMVLMPCGFGLERTLALARDITSRAGFGELSCARSRRVVAVDGSSYFNRPGPRLIDGLEMLAAIVRAKPGDRLPPGAAWVGA